MFLGDGQIANPIPIQHNRVGGLPPGYEALIGLRNDPAGANAPGWRIKIRKDKGEWADFDGVNYASDRDALAALEVKFSTA
jgi:hypothetical protein